MNNTSYCRSRPPSSTGFTLVELMVAMAIGLVVVLISTNLLLSNINTYKANDGLGHIQEGQRAAFELMARDIREAGQNSCGAHNIANVVRNSGAIASWSDWATGAIKGFDDAQSTDIVSTGSAETNRVSGTDAILLMKSDQAQSQIVSHNSGTATLTLQSASAFSTGDIAIACDAQSGAIFEVGSVDSTANTVAYDTSSAPLNCSQNLSYEGIPTPVSCTAYTSRIFSGGGFVAKLTSHLWYIGTNASGGKSLYRATVSKNAANTPSISYEEMISDVQDLQITYVVRDMSAATPTLGTTWIDASAIDDWSAITTTEFPVAVKLKLDFVSPGMTDGSRYAKSLITVVGLRNRELN